jgi:toluene monooxygenase system ferredoxin subunit
VSFQRVCAVGELWPGEMRGLVVDGKRILLVNADGRILAYANRCAHQSVELSGGKLDACILTCPAHEWQYDVRTGVGVNPRGARLTPFPIRIEGNDVFVDADPASDEKMLVGPVFQKSGGADFVIAALLEENPGATLVDRGSYIRVLVPRRCRLSREAVERHSHVAFQLPGDLELLMCSFKGRLTITDAEATWELGGP